MIRKGIILISLVLTATVLIISSCNLNPVDEENEREIRLVYTDWSESVALTHLASVLLEQKLGYDVVLKLTDVESAYQELAEEKADVFADAWLPETQKKYFEQHADKIEKLGITYPEARTGFVVPEYSKLKTISDLKDYPFHIVGIDSGAGVMHKAAMIMNKYELPGKLLNLSEEIMVQQLQDSIKRRQEIVVTGWEPHWIFARYEVRFLEDPDALFGEKEKIYSIARKGLEKNHPHAVRFFERMQLSEKQLNSLVYEVRVSDDPKVGVKKWMKQNEYIVNQWVKNLKPERKKIM